VGISSNCLDVARYTETVHLAGRRYRYPFGLMRKPRFLASAVASHLRRSAKTSSVTAANWFSAKYGPALAREVAIPLIEAWSGLPATELSAAVGDSIPSSILQTLYLSVARKVMRRAIAIGYSRDVPASVNVWHVYPQGGLSVLCQKLADPCADSIELESPVEAIYVDNERAVGVRVNGKDVDASAVISTAPVHVLPKLIRGTNRLDYLNRFRFRAMVFVNLRLKGRGLFSDVVTWFPERQFPFFRLTEAPASMPWLAPEGKTLLTADLGCRVGDEIWTMKDEQLGELVVNHLAELIPNARERYLGCRVLRTPIAYPVFALEYEQDRRRFAASTGIDGLYSIGRNGEFAHIFMEDVYWRSLKKSRGVRQLYDSADPHQGNAAASAICDSSTEPAAASA
jgi:protoporphyrinogen oxidase